MLLKVSVHQVGEIWVLLLQPTSATLIYSGAIITQSSTTQHYTTTPYQKQINKSDIHHISEESPLGVWENIDHFKTRRNGKRLTFPSRDIQVFLLKRLIKGC